MTKKSCPPKITQTPLPSDSNSSTPTHRARKKRTKKQQRNHKVPDHCQEMLRLLAFTALEKTPCRNQVVNRYGFLTFLPGGRFYGLPADIRVVMIRIFDLFRLQNHGSEPLWFLRRIQGDPFNNEQLNDANPSSHDLWKMDLVDFSAVKDRDELSDEELQSLLVACIRRNFKAVKCYFRGGAAPVFGPLMPVPSRNVRKSVNAALAAPKLNEEMNWTVVPVPGWTKACQFNWEAANERHTVESLQKGQVDCSLLRLVQMRPEQPAKTCVKGGRNV